MRRGTCGDRPAERVVLVTMPFGPVEYPSLGLGLLQAHCRHLDVPCETRYFTIAFADLVGLHDYRWVTRGAPYGAFVGDWLFADALYGPRPEVDERYLSDLLPRRWRLGAADVDRLRRMRDAVPAFLEHCVGSVDRADPTLVGFTSVFQQNLASLALAQRLTARHPELCVAFGGANWEEPMGSALRRQFPFVDLSFSGEADRSWPAVLEARRRGVPPAAVPGVDAGPGGTPPVPPELVADLDELPLPDFDPYFEQLATAPGLIGVRPSLLLETARGCWWGERSHCTFCGLNGSSMGFRAKSAGRVLEEIAALGARHGLATFGVVDNIMDMRYFRTLLPRLADEGTAELCWEVKANLTRRQVAALHAAGVRTVQPGIESLSDHVLELMGKGTTVARNVELLKWCTEHGVTPLWNLIYGVPGERAEDYRQLADVVDTVWHLPPPVSAGPLRLDRFSPYHAHPGRYGIVGVRPAAALVELYPFASDVQMDVAYYFDFDYAEGRAAGTHAAGAMALVRAWTADRRRGALWARAEEGAVLLEDSRRAPDTVPDVLRLDGWRAAVYLACDRARDLDDLLRLEAVQAAGAHRTDVVAFLSWARARRLVLRTGDRWLGVAVHRPARPVPAPDGRRSLPVDVASTVPAR
jgi:ribosomal peptide maturation radical SAM protein 1